MTLFKHSLAVVLLFSASACKSDLQSAWDINPIRTALVDSSHELPKTLAETTLFKHPVHQLPAEGVIPYNVKVPFWSDQAHKQRYVFVPAHASLGYDEKKRSYVFPVGTVFAKHFFTGNTADKFIETRVMVMRDNNKWAFTTYRWKSDHSTEAVSDVIELNDVSTDHKPYRVPANEECQGCHNSSRGYVLGFKPEQQNFTSTSGLNELDVLKKSIRFDEKFSELKTIAAFPDPTDASLDIDARARSYLDVNCSYCHNPTGPAPFFDTRQDVPLAATKMLTGNIINPGNADTSLLWQSLMTMDVKKRMPFTSVQVDHAGVELIKTWIERMKTPSP